MPQPLAVPQRALAIGAHPDDTEFGCAASLAKWAAAGCVVHHLVCTDGAKGTWNPEADLSELVVVRQREQRAAADTIRGSSAGNGRVVFLDWPDGELEASLRQRWQVTYWIRVLQPDVVFGHDPWKRYRLHPDHRAAGQLTCDALIAARDPHFFPEQAVAPHRPTTLLLFEADEPDHIEDVTGFGDVKLAALEAHRSQFESTMHVPETEPDSIQRFRRRIRDELAEAGRRIGVAEGEAFKRIDDL